MATTSKSAGLPAAVRHRSKPLADVDLAVALAQWFATQGRTGEVAARAEAVLGPELWAQCEARWKTRYCRRLARAARRIGSTNLNPAVGWRAWIRWLGLGTKAGLLVDGIVETVQSTKRDPTASATTVRLVGLGLCLAHEGPEGAVKCACARVLVHQAKLQDVLSALLTM